MERAKQMWPSEMPSCQIVEGGIIVDAKTVALAAQELMHKVSEQCEAELIESRRAAKSEADSTLRGRMEYLAEMGFPYGCTWDEAIAACKELRARFEVSQREASRLQSVVREKFDSIAADKVFAEPHRGDRLT